MFATVYGLGIYRLKSSVIAFYHNEILTELGTCGKIPIFLKPIPCNLFLHQSYSKSLPPVNLIENAKNIIFHNWRKKNTTSALPWTLKNKNKASRYNCTGIKGLMNGLGATYNCLKNRGPTWRLCASSRHASSNGLAWRTWPRTPRTHCLSSWDSPSRSPTDVRWRASSNEKTEQTLRHTLGMGTFLSWDAPPQRASLSGSTLSPCSHTIRSRDWHFCAWCLHAFSLPLIAGSL